MAVLMADPAVFIVKKMGGGNKEAPHRHYNCFVPAGNKQVAANNNYKTGYQHKHRQKTVPLPDICNAYSPYTHR